jgi:hypothetical protein
MKDIMDGGIEEAEPQSGYCKPFKTNNITIESCKIKKEISLKGRDDALRKCRRCPGLFKDDSCNEQLIQFKEVKAPVTLMGYCRECKKHPPECTKFYYGKDLCSACYQRLRRAVALD